MNVKSKIKRILSQTTAPFQNNVELGVFFFFLTTSLFLGDGKQPFVDAWWALGILTMYALRYYQRGKLDLSPLPRLAGLAWTTLIVYYIMLIPFSDSAGYSITATMRLIEGYLIYVLFVSIQNETSDSRNRESLDSGNQITALFVKCLLFVGVVATLTSFVFILFPSLARFLPSMNLLYANYGHNHLAGLLLFVFPATIGLVDSRNQRNQDSGNLFAWAVLSISIIGMILTFARGAWILLVFYLVIRFVKNIHAHRGRMSLAVAAIVAIVFLSTSLVSLYRWPQNNRYLRPISTFIFKPPLPSDNRWEYWRQAVEAIKERPVFGSGPGTFYLLSRRYQSAPNSWSWFAHSFPLQTAAETGLVGLFFVSALLWHIFRRASWGPLLTGTMLIFTYGLYEFVFDYISVWIVFLAALGLITQKTSDVKDKRVKQIGMALICIVVLTVFYGSSLISLLAKILKVPKVAFYSAPYMVDAARPTPFGRLEVKLMRAMHSRNPDIIRDLYNDTLSLEPDEKTDLVKSVYWDPKNTESAIHAARIFSKTNSPAEEIAVYKYLKNQQMTGIQRDTISVEIAKMIEKNEDNDIFLLDLYELVFAYNRWTNGVGHTIYDPIERMSQLIQRGKEAEAKRTLSRFLSLWPKKSLMVNAEQNRIVIRAGLMLGDIFEKEGKTEEAIEVIQKILTLDARRPETIKKLAWLAIKNGNINTYNSVQRLCELSYPGEQWCGRLVVDNGLAREWKDHALESLSRGNIISGVEKLKLAIAAYPYGGEYYRPLIESLVSLDYQEEARRVVARCIEFNKPFGGATWCDDFL